MEEKQLLSRILKTELVKWKDLQFIQQEDFKEWTLGGDQKLFDSLLRYQFVDPFKVWQNEGVIYCLDGKHRCTDLKKIEESGIAVPDLLPAVFIDSHDKKEAAELVLIYSSRYARITERGFMDFVKNYELNPQEFKMTVDLPDFDPVEFEGLFTVKDGAAAEFDYRSLRNKMREALGREPEWDEIIAYARNKGLRLFHGASIFDPVLCEIVYKWFCNPGGFVLDPFAGGSVRGIVAGVVGLKYTGIDLRPDQVTANEQQRDAMNLPVAPIWITGDSNIVLDDEAKDYECDLLFSCPPYHDLEQYSDDPADLSNMEYADFISIYRSIIAKAVARLKQDRFACFVVGDIRAKDGYYRNFVSDTIAAFQDAAMKLYNEIILVNIAGSLAIRVGRQFTGYRKVGKMHQNVLVFYKGDTKKIRENYPDIQINELEIEP